MTVETETALLKAIEKIEQKLDKFIETTQKDLTDLKVGQAKLEGKVETLTVEVQNIKEDVKEQTSEQKLFRAEVSALYKWIIGTFIVAAIGASNIFLKLFDFLPSPTH